VPLQDEIFSRRRRSWHSWEIRDSRRSYNTRARTISSASNQNSWYLQRDTSRPFYHVTRSHRLKIPGIFASKLDTVRHATLNPPLSASQILAGGKYRPLNRRFVRRVTRSRWEFDFRERSV